MRVMRRTLAIVCVVVMTAGAVAQPPPTPPPAEQRFVPPQPRTPAKPPLIGNILTALVIAAGVIGVCLIPSKRTHQD